MTRQRRDTIQISAYETVGLLCPAEPMDKYGRSPQSAALIEVGKIIAWAQAQDERTEEVQP